MDRCVLWKTHIWIKCCLHLKISTLWGRNLGWIQVPEYVGSSPSSVPGFLLKQTLVVSRWWFLWICSCCLLFLASAWCSTGCWDHLMDEAEVGHLCLPQSPCLWKHKPLKLNTLFMSFCTNYSEVPSRRWMNTNPARPRGSTAGSGHTLAEVLSKCDSHPRSCFPPFLK